MKERQPPWHPWSVAHHMALRAWALLPLAAATLAIGMAIYHFVEGLGWPDSFLNSAMLLGGMGPVNPIRTEGGKLFAGFYALYSGLVFLIAAGILGAPVVHRLLHRFHWEVSEKSK